MSDLEAELVESPNPQTRTQAQTDLRQTAAGPVAGEDIASDQVARVAESARQDQADKKNSPRRNRSLVLGLAVGGALGIFTLGALSLAWLAWNSNLNPWREVDRGASVAASKVSDLFERDVLQIQEQIVDAKKKIESAKAEHDALEQEKTALELEIKDLEAKTKL